MNARRGWIALLLGCLAYTALFLATYPTISAIEDEVGFVNQALAWSRGAITSEGAGFAEVYTNGEIAGDIPHLMDFIRVGDHHVPGRHPGRSLILLPFVMIGGVPAGFLSGLAIHLGVTLIGAGLLARLGKSPAWAFLILLHPTLAIYSRTILGDEAAGGCLLLAALFATVPGRRAAVAAGLAAGLAALMRYHAGLGLPIVAASIALDPLRGDRRRGDGLACLVAGGFVGLGLVAYNLALYHAPLDAPGASRGEFGLRYLVEQAPFYAVALMAFWPGMLIAPALDRSPVRGIARGVAAVYFVFFSLYYWHDTGSSPAETLIAGLRLMQVALPVWIVSYAVVVDDRIVTPLRRRIGPRATALAALAVVAVLFAAVAIGFRKHRVYLHDLESARDVLAAEAPSGSVVVQRDLVAKLFGIPGGRPVYRWRSLRPEGTPYDSTLDPMLDGLRTPWFLAILARGGAPSEYERGLIDRHKMREVPTGTPALILYRADPGPSP
jgi:hypothetical protein